MPELITLYLIGQAIKKDRENNGYRLYYSAKCRPSIHGVSKYIYLRTRKISSYNSKSKLYNSLTKYKYLKNDDQIYTIRLCNRMTEAMEDKELITLRTAAGNMV